MHGRLYAKRTDDEGVPITAIREIAGDERVREVARMLSGDAGEASLAHAREMLAGVVG